MLCSTGPSRVRNNSCSTVLQERTTGQGDSCRTGTGETGTQIPITANLLLCTGEVPYVRPNDELINLVSDIGLGSPGDRAKDIEPILVPYPPIPYF